jgi:hypothetical protein
MAHDAADNFCADQAKGSDHGPAENAGTQGWVLVAVMAAAMPMRVALMRMVMVMAMSGRGSI